MIKNPNTNHPHSLRRALAAGLALALLAGCESTGTTGGSGGAPDPALASATKEAPYVNSLGMKFVPVPGTKILMCTTETTVSQYQAAGRGYQAPDFPQGSNHPAVNVSWNDAKAWCRSMSARDGKKYRLPTEAGWTAAVGYTTYPWGNQWPPPNNAGNYAGQEWKSPEGAAYAKRTFSAGQASSYDGSTIKFSLISGFRDKAVFTAPVGIHGSNSLGLSDMGGNVWEWCEDWSDGSRKYRVLRGGSWFNGVREGLASSYRYNFTPDYRYFNFGFRCVVER